MEQAYISEGTSVDKVCAILLVGLGLSVEGNTATDEEDIRC